MESNHGTRQLVVCRLSRKTVKSYTTERNTEAYLWKVLLHQIPEVYLTINQKLRLFP